MNTAINIDALLKSSTYQGMTDEEIQALMDYKLQTLEMTLRNEFSAQLQAREQSDLYYATLAAAECANGAFQRALDLHVNYQTVSGGLKK